ncbi:MAG: glycoside hydrolase family 16 protein [Bacteroidota bacterium]
MNRVCCYIFVLSLGFGFSSCTKEVSEVSGCIFAKRANMDLVWDEEFEGSDLDTLTSWKFFRGDGCPDNCRWGNNESQFYTDTNVYVSDSVLTIFADKQVLDISSGRITTEGLRNLNSGRIDVRAKLPLQSGIWPFLSIGPTDIPIDSLEARLFENAQIDFLALANAANADIVNQNFSYRDPDTALVTIGSQYQFAEQDSVDFSEDFHEYSIQWTSDCVRFFVDNNEVAPPLNRSTILPSGWPFDQPLYLTIGLDVGGNNGEGSVGILTPYPQEFKIDYVKFYQ